MMLKTCPRCGRLMKYGKDYCGECLKKVEEERKERDRRYNKTRDPKYLAFYNSKEWKELSRTYTATKHYRCEECGAIGRDVHHKAPIQTEYGWRHRLDVANLILLCVNCHNKKHGRFRKRGEKGECKDERCGEEGTRQRLSEEVERRKSGKDYSVSQGLQKKKHGKTP